MPVCDVNGCDFESDSEHAVATHKGKEHPEEGCWKECDNCGEEFRVRPSKSDQRENCSTECMKESLSEYREGMLTGSDHPRWTERVEKECEVCGEIFEVVPDRKSRRSTCGDDSCYKQNMRNKNLGPNSPTWEGGKTTYECVVCGEEFEDYESSERVHCGSSECQSKHHSQILKSMDDFHGNEGNHTPPGNQTIEVEETGHVVRSGWEKCVDLILHNSPLSYFYEPFLIEFEDGSGYRPDFVVGEDLIIEVKGYVRTNRSENKAQKLMGQYRDSFTFIVLGTELPCDFHLEWEERHELLDVIERVTNCG